MKEQKPMGATLTKTSQSSGRAPGKQKRERTDERMKLNKQFSAQIQAQADRRGLDRAALASKALDISLSYCNALMNGDRLWDEANFDIIRNAATLLGLPALGVLRTLNIVHQGDWAVNTGVDLKKEMEYASLDRMRRDPMFSAFACTDEQWDTDPERVRFMAKMAYDMWYTMRVQLMAMQTGGDFAKLTIDQITPKPTREEFESVAAARAR